MEVQFKSHKTLEEVVTESVKNMVLVLENQGTFYYQYMSLYGEGRKGPPAISLPYPQKILVQKMVFIAAKFSIVLPNLRS